MSTATHRPPSTGRSEDALDIAIALADAEGIAAVTPAAVAARAGLSAAVLRRDVGGRDRLVAQMVQRLLTRRRTESDRPGSDSVRPEAPDGPTATLELLAQHEWSAYRAHPWLVDVLASTRPPLVPAVLDSARDAIAAFMALGFDIDSAFRRYLAFSAYFQGVALLLHAEDREEKRSGTRYRSWWHAEMRRLGNIGADLTHPWLRRVADTSPDDAFDANAVFVDGLRLVLTGLERP